MTDKVSTLPAARLKASRFTRERLAEIEPNPIRYLVKPFVPRTGVGVIAGPSTSAKTFLALEMALRISRGEPFHGHKVRQAGVLYLSAEDPEGVRLRIKAWCLINGTDGHFQLIPQAPDLRDGEKLAELLAAIRAGAFELDAEGCALGLVIIDTLSKASPGADQNSSADMGLVMSALAKISSETGAMVMVVAHTPKDETRGIAGWYGQYAGADVVIMTSRDVDDPALRTVTLSKVKNGQDGQKLAFRLEVVEVGQDEDGDPVTSCVVAFEDAPAKIQRTAKPAAKLNPPETMALRAIRYMLDNGQPQSAPAIQGVPSGTLAASLREARAHALKSGFSDEGERPDTVKKRWSRALESLVAKEKVRLDGDLVWPV
jgi:putative DNA primase/helicase